MSVQIVSGVQNRLSRGGKSKQKWKHQNGEYSMIIEGDL